MTRGLVKFTGEGGGGGDRSILKKEEGGNWGILKCTERAKRGGGIRVFWKRGRVGGALRV